MTPRPTIAGIYDTWLGGHTNLAADRDAAARVAERFPGLPGQVRAARDFQVRVAAWCAGQGVGNFIRAGAVTYLAGANIHNAVQRVTAGTRVVYVNGDADPALMAAELLADGKSTGSVHAPVRCPEKVLSAPPVAEMLAGGRPAAMILGLLAHHESGERAARLLRAYAGALPPGSYLAFSLIAGGGEEAVAGYGEMMPAPAYRHGLRDVEAWVDGLDLVPPGVADVRFIPGWRVPLTAPAREPGFAAGAVIRVRQARPAGAVGRT